MLIETANHLPIEQKTSAGSRVAKSCVSQRAASDEALLTGMQLNHCQWHSECRRALVLSFSRSRPCYEPATMSSPVVMGYVIISQLFTVNVRTETRPTGTLFSTTETWCTLARGPTCDARARV